MLSNIHMLAKICSCNRHQDQLPEAKAEASHSCSSIIKTIVTDCAPCAIVKDFQPSNVLLTSSSNQSHRVLH